MLKAIMHYSQDECLKNLFGDRERKPPFADWNVHIDRSDSNEVTPAKQI